MYVAGLTAQIFDSQYKGRIISYIFDYDYVPLTHTDEKFWSFKVKMAKFDLLWKLFFEYLYPFLTSNNCGAYICTSISLGLGINALIFYTALLFVELGAVQKSK